MQENFLILYVPPILFSVVALAFVLLWYMEIAAWQWGAGFAQTAAGFVVSTFFPEPSLAAFISGLIFIGAAYCYGSALLVHFNAQKQRIPRLTFVAAYVIVLVYLVYVRQSLVGQLFLTDAGFAFLLGWSLWVVARKASRRIDVALVATSSIVVLDSVTRAIFFTFFTNSSDKLSDFATSLYNLEVSITTITICMLFPFAAIGASAAAAIEKHRIVAETDPLTGLFNRRGFGKALECDSKSGKLRGSLIVCDIDHFKRVNDTHGHAIGDVVIEGIAKELNRLIGSYGRAARYGGEEFVIFLPYATLADATTIAELLRVSIAEKDWHQHGLDHGVTISCGVASLNDADYNDADNNVDEAIRRADRALYAAKGSGRNRVKVESASAIEQRGSDKTSPTALALRK